MFPIAKRPGEYVAFVVYVIHTLLDGNGYFFLAIDAFNGLTTQLGMETNDNAETILKYIDLLMEYPDIAENKEKGFTLILCEYEEISEKIKAIVSGANGRLLFDKTFHDNISEPALKSLADYLERGLLKYNN